jgi:hypothetical protein
MYDMINLTKKKRNRLISIMIILILIDNHNISTLKAHELLSKPQIVSLLFDYWYSNKLQEVKPAIGIQLIISPSLISNKGILENIGQAW